MKIELTISRQSKDVCMGKCPEYSEGLCGIMYRAS